MTHEISEEILRRVRDLFPPNPSLQPIRAVVILECQEIDDDGKMGHRMMMARSDSATPWSILGLLAYAEVEAKMDLGHRIAHAAAAEEYEIEYEDDDDAED